MSVIGSDREFWNEFLDLYRSLPYLWWDKADYYTTVKYSDTPRNKTAKAKEKLLAFCKQKYPEADMEFVSKKIHNFRCGFHREYRKKRQMEAMGQVHRPVLWYYKKLLFLVDEENAMDLIDDDNSNDSKKNENNLIHSNEEMNITVDETTKSIDIKIEPIQYVEEVQEQVHDKKNKLDDKPLTVIIVKIPENLEVKEKLLEYATECYSETSMVANKNQLNSTKLNETATKHKPEKNTSEQLKMSEKPVTSDSTETVQSSKRKHNEIETDETNQQTIKVKRKKIKLNDIYNLIEPELNAKDDMFDIIGRKIANDLREMTKPQRIIADKIINDVLYYGKSNLLQSTYSFNPSL